MAHWSRRRFLEIAGLAGGAVALKSFLGGGRALASEQDPQLLLFAYFSGGWDQLLALDPRPNNASKYSEANAYAPGGSGIFPAYDQVIDPTGVEAVLAATGGTGIQQKGKIDFGPAIPASLLDHYLDLCVVRGLSMDTLTHEVGRRYFLTGKFPRGLAPNGSSLNTVVADVEGAAALIPNLAISTESYNEGRPAYASPIRVNSADDVLNVLKPLGTALDPDSDAALEEFEKAADTCEQHALNANGLIDLFKASRVKARSITNSTASALFKFTIGAPPPEVQPLFDALQITTTADLNGPKGKAAIAAQALTHGISQAVSVQLSSNLDDHFDWGDSHGTTLRTSFDALGLLIKYLKAAQFGTTADTVWQHTTLVVFSEFARGPLLNGRNGRDHHLASSCLVAGPGLKGNTVIGATQEPNMAVSKVHLDTGAAVPDSDEAGVILRPADIHATVLSSMGLSYDHIANQSPQVVQAMLK